MKRCLSLLAILVAAGLLCAQVPESVFGSGIQLPSLYDWQYGRGSSIFNPDNLHINHTVAFSAGGSSTGQGFYESRYTNHLTYQFNPNLDLKVDLNFMNFGTASFNSDFDIEDNGDNQTRVLPDFSLEYRPSKNTVLRFEVNTSGYGVERSSFYPSRYDRRRW